jgi:Ca2+-binding EF-hand superfamily protein
MMRDIIDDLFSVEKSMQKLELIERCKKFEQFEDKYDEISKNVKTVFTDFDEDFDHLLVRKEFYNLLTWLAGYQPDNKEEIFTLTDTNKDGKISFTELKENFLNIVKMIRINNVLRNISDIIRK